MKTKKKKGQEFVDNMTSLSRGEGFIIEMTYGLTLSTPTIQFSTIVFHFQCSCGVGFIKLKKVKTLRICILE